MTVMLNKKAKVQQAREIAEAGKAKKKETRMQGSKNIVSVKPVQKGKSLVGQSKKKK